MKRLFQNGHLAKASAMSQLLGRIAYKARWYGPELITVDTFYPSSKTCFDCGAVNQDLKLEKS